MNTDSIKTAFGDALPIIEKFAPALGTAIGGPAGFVMSMVVPLLAKAFGTEPTNIHDIVQNIVNDDAAPLKLQGLEAQHHDWLCAVTQNLGRISSAELNVKLAWK